MTDSSLQQSAPAFGKSDGLKRTLNNRQIQLISIGGSIGTALFISIGNGLAAGGPASLLLAFIAYSLVMACINNCIAEMVVEYPVSGGFVRLAGRFVDDALGFMVGWNFFLYEALLVPFEITALNLLLKFWRDDIPAVAVILPIIFAYGVINAISTNIYGQTEFCLSSGKVFLIFLLFSFTLFTAAGANPQHEVYGFRYWKNPGAFAEHPLRTSSGNSALFEGFLGALWTAAFTIVGPEYISMVAAEAKRLRQYLKLAYKVMYWRFGLFFILGAFCVGIIVPWNDPVLQSILAGKAGGAATTAASPYLIAMKNMGVSVLPHIINAWLFTSIFSAGNNYTFCATRTLHSLALEGRAPKFLTRCSKKGVPYCALIVVMAFPFLSFLRLSGNASKALTWLINVITAGALIDFIVMCITFICFHRACCAQGVDRKQFRYVERFQPYSAWIGLITTVTVCLSYGYTSFSPWSLSTFLQNYTMQLFALVAFGGWKLIKGTRWLKPHEVDLVWERPMIDAYEAAFVNPPDGFWIEILQMVHLRKDIRNDEKDMEMGALTVQGQSIIQPADRD